VSDKRQYLITGGTGSFGHAVITELLKRQDVERIVVYSRDELKQSVMRQTYTDPRLRWFIGDTRDLKRLTTALRGITHVIHAAAMKQVPACEYNPQEAIKTNIFGAMNLVDAAIDAGVEQVVALSTDKACNPINLYGATKLCSDKLIVNGNVQSAGRTRFSVVRYGNISGSRGSIIPIWKQLLEANEQISITDESMTRFWFTLDKAVEFTLGCMERAVGGEIFVPNLRAYDLGSLARACINIWGVDNNKANTLTVGPRPGEKKHEAMIGPDDSQLSVWFEEDQCFAILPHPDTEIAPPLGGVSLLPFTLSSDKAPRMDVVNLVKAIKELYSE